MNGKYTARRTGSNSEKWVKERLIRKILQKETDVFDKVQDDAVPIKCTVKEEITAWLRKQQGVTCDATRTELQLHKLIKLQMPKEKPYRIHHYFEHM